MCPDGLERTSCTLMTRHGIVDIDAISGTLCDSVQARLKTYTTRTPGLHMSLSPGCRLLRRAKQLWQLVHKELCNLWLYSSWPQGLINNRQKTLERGQNRSIWILVRKVFDRNWCFLISSRWCTVHAHAVSLSSSKANAAGSLPTAWQPQDLPQFNECIVDWNILSHPVENGANVQLP